jgi:hypothetical protein
MKIKILVLSLIGLIFFNSCSTDNNSDNSTTQNLDPNTLLPKQIMITEPLFNRFFKLNFFYNGNKIDHINNTYYGYDFQNQYFEYNSVTNYTYNGDLITKIGDINLTYQNGKIVSYSSNVNNGLDNFVDFQYQTNGTITRTYNLSCCGSYILSITNLSNGLPSILSEVNSQTTQYSSEISYTPTNSVYKNIVGFSSVLSNLFV